MGDVSPEVFKRAVGSFATGVTVVTAADRRGQRYGFTANSFASVSLDPPLVLLCLARRAPSAWAFEPGRQFNVNILAADQQALSGHFASPNTDKFATVAFHEGNNGLPVLDHCHAHLECRLEHWYHGGDHLILVGWVERAEVDDDNQPLLFHRSRYISATPAAP